MKKILVTGGDGRFASELKKVKTKFKLIFCSKRELDICSKQSINKKNFKIQAKLCFAFSWII